MALLVVGYVDQNTNDVEQSYPESSINEKSLIDYSIVRVEQHEIGVSIDANVLVQSNATLEEVRQLLEYFMNTRFKGYDATTIIIYNNMTSAQNSGLNFNPNDPYLVGQLNKYTRVKGELGEGKITLY
ncbi:hypothetical protein [Methanococcoides alaskense]|uniref:Uncharacterized protein n=1 Tax=Methanococcoides alaskense TaxID=325778 RepID=A0AA90U173_9EURY|nr:hypothetical protein [Methanococcoides alaskense]MDR6223812.1 hypothetical protein [Methanococcoides alaskense]